MSQSGQGKEMIIETNDAKILTGCRDKDGWEIYVGSTVLKDKVRAKIIYDGDTFLLMYFSNVVLEELTPELAKTLEVVA